MISAKQLVDEGLAYIDSLSIDELEALFIEVGLEPVRKTDKQESFTFIETEMYSVISSHVIVSDFDTSFSSNDSYYIDVAA
jgi:hypothetical protein